MTETEINKLKTINDIIYRLFMLRLLDNISVVDILLSKGYKNIAFYGYNNICNIALHEYHNAGFNNSYIIDKRAKEIIIDYPVFRLEDVSQDYIDNTDVVLVCLSYFDDGLISDIHKVINKDIVWIGDLVYEI